METDVSKKIESIVLVDGGDNSEAVLENGGKLVFDPGITTRVDVKKENKNVMVKVEIEEGGVYENDPRPTSGATVYAALEEAKKELRKELAGGELELIASVTVAPDTDGTLPQSVVISQDSEGNAFNLSEFRLMCNVGSSGENKSISVLTNESDYVFSNVNIALKDTKKQWFVHYLNLGQFGGIAYAPATAETKYPNANISSMRLQAYPERTTHNKITLRVPTGYTFTEGTTFELWGVRA